MRFLLFTLLLFFTPSLGLMAQGILVRSDGGLMTNGAFYGLSTFRGLSGTLRLYGESSSANKKDYRLSSGSDLLSFIWLNDAGNSALILGSVDALGNWSFTGDAAAVGNFSAASYGSDFNIFGAGNTARLRLGGTAFGPGTNVWDVDPAGFTFTHSAGASYNYRFQAGSVIATRFVGSGSNLTDIAVSGNAITNALGYQPATNAFRTNTIGVSIDGGGSAIVAGRYGNYLTVPYDCTIIGVRVMGDHNGTAVMDVWKTNWTGYPPTVANSITASAKPTLTATNRVEDLVLTDWNTNVTAGDVFGWNVDSSATFTNLTLQLLLRH